MLIHRMTQNKNQYMNVTKCAAEKQEGILVPRCQVGKNTTLKNLEKSMKLQLQK